MKRFIDVCLYIRQQLRRFYAEYSTYILMAAKTVTAVALFLMINQAFPYRAILDREIVILAIALLCSILPWNYMTVIACVWLLAQLSGFSLEITLFVLVLLLALAVLRYLMLPGCSLVLVLLPVLAAAKIPYMIPLIVGLTAGLSGFVSVGSGVVLYYVLLFVTKNQSYFTEAAGHTLVERLLFLVKGFIDNREMLMLTVIFCMTAILVHLISRIDVKYAHIIAAVVGAVLMPLTMMMSEKVLHIGFGIGGEIWGSVLGLAVTLLVDWIRSGLVYARTESVQFEDDDYYYFVKAVPKIRVVDPRTGEEVPSSNATLQEAMADFTLPDPFDHEEPARHAEDGSPERGQRAKSDGESLE